MNPGSAAPERDNFITPVRLALAGAVAVWHAFAVAAPWTFNEPALNGLSPSYLAVNGFFILSGFLIARSAERRDLINYAAARVLRLYPALIALIAVGTLFAAALHLFRPDIADAPGSWLYPLKSVFFINASGTLPGLFADNPRTEFALSLWTLRYEAAAYVALPIAVALGLLKGPLRAWALWAVLAIAFAVQTPHPDWPAILFEGSRLGCAFMLGVAIHASRGILHLLLRVEALVIALGLAGLAYPTDLFEDAANLVLAWAMFRLCFAPARGAAAKLTRIPDWSYGLYIWHWPVYQTLKLTFPEAGPGLMLSLGLCISLLIAAVSWSFIERPALAQKDRLAALLRARLRRPAAAAAA